MPKTARKVLVVEDDASLREAIERLFGAAGFTAGAYASAEALLANGAAGSAACIVCDLKLPAMSGFDLLEEVRARGWRAPFILITAHDAPGLRDEALQRGAAAYLAKPFRGTTLLEAVEDLLGSTAQTDPTRRSA